MSEWGRSSSSDGNCRTVMSEQSFWGNIDASSARVLGLIFSTSAESASFLSKPLGEMVAHDCVVSQLPLSVVDSRVWFKFCTKCVTGSSSSKPSYKLSVLRQEAWEEFVDVSLVLDDDDPDSCCRCFCLNRGAGASVFSNWLRETQGHVLLLENNKHQGDLMCNFS